MIKYIIDYTKDSTCICEVECEELFSYSWEVLPGEKRYKVLSKKHMFQDQYPIWYSWAVYDSEALAMNAAAGDIRRTLERQEQKGGSAFDEQELIKLVAAITVKKLEKR